MTTDDDADPFLTALMRSRPNEAGPPDVAEVLAAYIRRPAWHQDAACLGVGPASFFVERGVSTAPAKAMCATCPVADECAEAGRDEPAGIWAGTSPVARLVRSSGHRRPAA